MKIELPDCLDESVKELATPVFKEAGTTIGDLWFLALGGISQKASLRRVKYAHELEKYRKELEAELNAVPEEKRIEPSTQVVMNALTDSQSCVEEETLRSMFAKLIASASNSDKASRVHPSFPGLIKQMSPVDAEFLRMFGKVPVQPIVGIRLDMPDFGGGITLYKNIFIPDTGRYSADIQNQAVTCLAMLGLLEIKYDRSLTEKGVYLPFENLPEFKKYEGKTSARLVDGAIARIEKVKLEKGIVSLTALGESFIEVCT